MAGWAEGYVTDIQYVGNFYPELAPGFLGFACLREGVRPPLFGAGATYLELGCGQGYGLNLLAAANPGIAFWGVDFNPAHIANARRLAAAAGLDNITLDDLSFAELLSLPEGRLPKFDVIALHGVFSWVSQANRAQIVQILDRLLKPGGLAYVSYNCLPGWSANALLQHFLQEHAARSPAHSDRRVLDGLKAAQEMLEGGGRTFRSAPGLGARIDAALTRQPAYLAHEYMNAGAEPLFSADVARQMADARLDFAASATLSEQFTQLVAPAPLQPMIKAAADRTWRETLLDYASNRQFRRDIFVRGRNTVERAERDALFEAAPLALMVPPDAVTFEIKVPVGTLNGDPKTYAPLVEALADGPKTVPELYALPALSGATEASILQAITLMIARRQIHPSSPDRGASKAAAFNRAVVDRTAFGETKQQLAAGALGSGVELSIDDVLGLDAIFAGDGDVAAMAARAWRTFERTNRRLKKGDTMLKGQAAHEAEFAERMERFTATRLPQLRALGVL